MEFGLPVSLVERFGPALQRGVVGHDEIVVCTLQPFTEGGVVNGNGRLAGEGFQEIHPVSGRVQRAAMENLKYPLDLTLGQKRDGVIGDKLLLRQSGRTRKR